MLPMPGNIGLDNRRSAEEEELGDGEPDEELEPGGGVSCVGCDEEDEFGGGGGGPRSPGGRPGWELGVHGEAVPGEGPELTHR